jgi:hypothetical protein
MRCGHRRTRGFQVHGLLVELEIDADRAEEAIGFLHNAAIPMIKEGDGFVRGTWMRSMDGRRTRSLILYEDEATANAAADRARQGPPPGAPTRFVSAEVFEVMAEA